MTYEGEDQICCFVSKCLFFEPKAEWELEINSFSFSPRIDRGTQQLEIRNLISTIVAFSCNQ